MTKEENRRLVDLAVADLNEAKGLSLKVTDYRDTTDGTGAGWLEITMEAPDMMCPGKALITDETLDAGKPWQYDEKCGVKELLGRPDGIGEEACQRIRIAYCLWKQYRFFTA